MLATASFAIMASTFPDNVGKAIVSLSQNELYSQILELHPITLMFYSA